MDIITKEHLIEILQETQKKYDKTNTEIITRDFLRQKHGAEFEKQIIKHFGSFSRCKKEIGWIKDKQKKVKKAKQEIPFIQTEESKNKNKRYFISSIIAGADVNAKFMESVVTYCKDNGAEFLLIPMRGVRKADEFSEEVLNKYSNSFVHDIKFNDNLRAMDFCLSPEQVLPLTGLSRFGRKEFSIILASPKQMLLSVPRKKESLPHIILSTGTICEPDYNKSKMGKMATQDNVLGGLVVEIRNKDIFHIRHIQADKEGGFQDLDSYYDGKVITIIPAEAISIEPHYGIEDEVALDSIKEIITQTQCKRVLFHDVMDCRSVNPHEQKITSMKYYRPEVQKVLENELHHLANKLVEWNEEFPKLELRVVAANHELFIKRYLDSGDFVNDTHNVYLGCELFQSVLRKENPIEYFLNSRYAINNLKFLKEDESFSLNGVELNSHGHIGGNGSRGNPASIENINGKSTLGHSHSPQIFRDVFVTGCACKLQQDYNFANAGTSWLHGAVLQYKNGKRQLIIIIDGAWRI